MTPLITGYAGIGEDVTWEEFTALVCSRLQLRGLKGLYHAASGAPLRTMAELLDVEDLEAEASEALRPHKRRSVSSHSSFSQNTVSALTRQREQQFREEARRILLRCLYRHLTLLRGFLAGNNLPGDKR